VFLGDRSPRQPERPAKNGTVPASATLARSGSGNCESDQARAKQDKTRNGHGEKTVRSEFFTHGTLPIVRPLCVPKTLSELLT
jgi:hypothetical protein